MTALSAIVFGAPLLASGGIDGATVDAWMAIPFAGILLSIAITPLVAEHFWHHNFGKIALGWAILGAGILFASFSATATIYEILHIVLLDYVPFIILLLGLFTIAGGIRIKGTLRGSPKLNTAMLLIGTILASCMGTTGAAMLLIRPLIRANAWRKRKVHLVVFFIFLVANIGGSLTPLGDPPLFLGFLRGVEFTWTLQLVEEMAIMVVVLLPLFFIIDTMMLKKEEQQTPPAEEGDTAEKFGFEGLANVPLLLCLIGAILLGSFLGNTSFKDQDKFDEFKPALAAWQEKSDQHLAALSAFSEGEYKKSYDAYEKALDPELNAKLHQHPAAHAHDDHADEHDGEEHAEEHDADEQGDHDDEHGAAAHKDDGHDEHDGHDHAAHADPFETTKERAIAAGFKPEDAEYVAGGPEKRMAAVHAAMESKPSEEEAAALQALILLDFQRSLAQTNSVRAAQSHDATKGITMAIGHNHVTVPYANLVRDLIILLLVFISLKVTADESRKKNGFTWFPIVEVAKLFAGIFVCIIPALKMLQAGVDGAMAGVVNAVTAPDGSPINAAYFWLTGTLSAFLDNAPTYLVFFNTAGGDAQYLMTTGHDTLVAISCGAVFMGAMTYIGNAPNFMVKAIAEENEIKMPSFFGYMVWSVALLVPCFILITYLIF